MDLKPGEGSNLVDFVKQLVLLIKGVLEGLSQH